MVDHAERDRVEGLRGQIATRLHRCTEAELRAVDDVLVVLERSRHHLPIARMPALTPDELVVLERGLAELRAADDARPLALQIDVGLDELRDATPIAVGRAAAVELFAFDMPEDTER